MNQSIATSRSGASSAALCRFWPEIAAAVAALGSFMLLHNVTIGHDAVWQLWTARQLEHGARLYTDILELNPPLWFWMAVPVVRLAEIAGTQSADALKIAFFGVISLSLVLVGALQRDQSPVPRLTLYAALLLAFTVVALPDFAQREHYVLIASAPYVTLIAARSEGAEIPIWLAIVIGLLAASGFALKHYFAGVPIILEIWLIFSIRRTWKLMRPELAVLASCAIAYVLAVLIFAPDFVRTIVPMVRLAYYGYNVSLVAQFFRIVIPLSLLAGTGLVLYGGPRTALGKAAFITALTFLACYFLQQKGWRYHSLPALGMLLMIVGAESAVIFQRKLLSDRQRRGVLALACVMIMAPMDGILSGPYRNDKRAASQAALVGLAPRDTVMMLAVNASTIWPMVEELQLVWPSRYMILWMLPGIVRAQQNNNDSPELDALARSVRQQTLQDLLCHPPKRILVDDARFSAFLHGLDFDYLKFFAAEPGLSEFFDRYRQGPTFGRFSTLDLIDGGGIIAPAGCRAIF